MTYSDIVIKTDFERRTNQIKEDIETGKIILGEVPEFWNDEVLNTIALNCTLLLLAKHARWN